MKCWVGDLCDRGGCEGTCRWHYIMAWQVKAAEIPRKYWNLELSAGEGDEDVYQRLEWAQENIRMVVGEGYHLYLHGDGTGNGKTMWATRLLLSYIKANVKRIGFKQVCQFIYVPSFANDVKVHMMNGEKVSVDEYKHVPFLVLDDIGAVSPSQHDLSHLLSIIDYRVNNELSTIYTSNLDYDGLVTLFGSRLASRVYGGSEVFTFVSEDKRFK